MVSASGSGWACWLSCCRRSRPRPRRCARPRRAHFIAGKHFSYSCFDGTTGNGRIYADGSVAGYIQLGGSGPQRYVVLPTGTLRTNGDRYLRFAARHSVRALLQRRAHQPGQLPRLDLGARLRLLRFHAPAGARADPAPARSSARDAAPPAPVAGRQPRRVGSIGRKDHAGRRGVRVELAGAILQIAFRRRNGTAAMDDAAFRAHRSGVLA